MARSSSAGPPAITYCVDFARTDDHGHVIVGTAAVGDQVTMVDESGTRCCGTVVLHSPDLRILLVKPDPETCPSTVVAPTKHRARGASDL